MNIIDKIGELRIPGVRAITAVTEIILHDTVTSTVQAAIDTLKQRGLGYHYLIDKNGDIVQLAKPEDLMWHALKYNMHTIGISFIGGVHQGDITPTQINAAIELITELKKTFPLKTLAGHRHRTSEGKVDPTGVNCISVANAVNLVGPTTP